MTGSYYFGIRYRNLVCEFTLNRGITILKGDSGIGKTTIIDCIARYKSEGKSSGVHIQTNAPAFDVLDTKYWDMELRSKHNTIIFVDESFKFIREEYFSRLAKVMDIYIWL